MFIVMTRASWLTHVERIKTETANRKTHSPDKYGGCKICRTPGQFWGIRPCTKEAR